VRLRQRYILGAIMFGSRKPLAVRLSGCQAVRLWAAVLERECRAPGCQTTAGHGAVAVRWEVGGQTVRGGGQARLERLGRRRQRKRACYGRLGVLVACRTWAESAARGPSFFRSLSFAVASHEHMSACGRVGLARKGTGQPRPGRCDWLLGLSRGRLGRRQTRRAFHRFTPARRGSTARGCDWAPRVLESTWCCTARASAAEWATGM
jgi:hypothetical protein